MVHITATVFEHNLGSFRKLLNININKKSLRVGRFRTTELRPFSMSCYGQETCQLQAMGKTTNWIDLPWLEDPESLVLPPALLDAGAAIVLSDSPTRGSSSSDSIAIRDRFLAGTVYA